MTLENITLYQIVCITFKNCQKMSKSCVQMERCQGITNARDDTNAWCYRYVRAFARQVRKFLSRLDYHNQSKKKQGQVVFTALLSGHKTAHNRQVIDELVLWVC
jgi:hypothetical protein